MKLSPVIIPLDASIHALADRFSKYHEKRSELCQRVYMNTLCVCAVYDYLSQAGYDVDLESSDSFDPMMQVMMDVADLVIPTMGHLECRVVFAEQDFMMVAPEVWSDRLGFLAVRLDNCEPHPSNLDQLRSLKTATLLGFVQSVSTETVLLQELHPISALLTQLEQPVYQPLDSSPLHENQVPIQLTHWLQNIWHDGWKSLQDLVGQDTPPFAMSFRSQPNDELTLQKQYQKTITRGKKIPLLPNRSDGMVHLFVRLDQPSNLSDLDISVDVYPIVKNGYLPDDLNLVILNEIDEAVIQVKATDDNDFIHVQFSGEPGETFSVKLIVDQQQFVETFQI